MFLPRRKLLLLHPTTPLPFFHILRLSHRCRLSATCRAISSSTLLVLVAGRSMCCPVARTMAASCRVVSSSARGQGRGIEGAERREEARGGLAAATQSCGWGRERGTWVAAAAEEDALAIGLGFHWCRFCLIFPQLSQFYCATWPNRWSQNKANAQPSHDAGHAWIASEAPYGGHHI
jgi:hypothetical protein